MVLCLSYALLSPILSPVSGLLLGDIQSLLFLQLLVSPSVVLSANAAGLRKITGLGDSCLGIEEVRD